MCKLYSSGKKRHAPLVRAAVGISDYILDIHLGHGFFTDAAFTRTIHNPVIENETAPADRMSQRPSKVSLGFVGALAPHKGIETLLKSVKKLAPGRASLHVFGKPQSESYGAYLTSTYQSDDITFHGYRKPEEIYPSLDALRCATNRSAGSSPKPTHTGCRSLHRIGAVCRKSCAKIKMGSCSTLMTRTH